jgi:hypothetical protein
MNSEINPREPDQHANHSTGNAHDRSLTNDRGKHRVVNQSNESMSARKAVCRWSVYSKERLRPMPVKNRLENLAEGFRTERCDGE